MQSGSIRRSCTQSSRSHGRCAPRKEVFSISADGQNSEVPPCGGLDFRWFFHVTPPLKNPDLLSTLLKDKLRAVTTYSRSVKVPALVLAFSGVVSPSVIVLIGTNPLQVILLDSPAPAKSDERGWRFPAVFRLQHIRRSGPWGRLGSRPGHGRHFCLCHGTCFPFPLYFSLR